MAQLIEYLLELEDFLVSHALEYFGSVRFNPFCELSILLVLFLAVLVVSLFLHFAVLVNEAFIDEGLQLLSDLHRREGQLRRLNLDFAVQGV